MGEPNRGDARSHDCVRVQNRRTAAKTGLALTLGLTLATGLMTGRRARVLHLCSGVALVGFSIWHWSLYQTPHKHQGRQL